MDLESINYLSQTVAAFGVIISIIYFARKLKQNTKASRIKASYLTSKELRNSLGMVAKNNSLAEIFAKASISEDLTNVEKLRWYTYIGSTMRIFENSYTLMEKKGYDTTPRDVTNIYPDGKPVSHDSKTED